MKWENDTFKKHQHEQNKENTTTKHENKSIINIMAIENDTSKHKHIKQHNNDKRRGGELSHRNHSYRDIYYDSDGVRRARLEHSKKRKLTLRRI